MTSREVAGEDKCGLLERAVWMGGGWGRGGADAEKRALFVTLKHGSTLHGSVQLRPHPLAPGGMCTEWRPAAATARHRSGWCSGACLSRCVRLWPRGRTCLCGCGPAWACDGTVLRQVGEVPQVQLTPRPQQTANKSQWQGRSARLVERRPAWAFAQIVLPFLHGLGHMFTSPHVLVLLWRAPPRLCVRIPCCSPTGQ